MHKTNVLTFAGDLWQRTFDDVAREFPDVETAYNHVDAACIYFVQDPARYDVIVTDNLFGDILTDLGGAIGGGIGRAASANLNPARTGPSLFEPVHGSAPDIAGTGQGRPPGGGDFGRHDVRFPGRGGRRGPNSESASTTTDDVEGHDDADRRRDRRRLLTSLDERHSDAHHPDREDLDERRAHPVGRRARSTSSRTRCTTAPVSSRESARTRPSAGPRSSV